MQWLIQQNYKICCSIKNVIFSHFVYLWCHWPLNYRLKNYSLFLHRFQTVIQEYNEVFLKAPLIAVHVFFQGPSYHVWCLLKNFLVKFLAPNKSNQTNKKINSTLQVCKFGMNLFLHSAVVHSLMDQIMSHLNGAFY
jgi:hypothetical protein